jgi:hypothetical protein
MVRDPELEAFKTQIELSEYAVESGYLWYRQESWRGSAVMRKRSDKIIVKRDRFSRVVVRCCRAM